MENREDEQTNGFILFDAPRLFKNTKNNNYMENRKIRVAITHGDTNGVGYEVIFKTFAEPAMLDICTPIIYGSPKVAAYHRNALGIQANFTIINSAEEAHNGKLNLLPTFDEEVKVELGNSSKEAGAAAVALKAAEAAAAEDSSREGGEN